MKKIKVLRQIKPKIKSVRELNKEIEKEEFSTQESGFVEEGFVSKNRSSPTLEKINEIPEVETRTFNQSEGEKREETTRFYESVQNRQENRLKYETNSQSQIVGEVGMASARANTLREEDIFDRRNSLITRAGGLNSQASLPQNTSIDDRKYELEDKSNLQVKRRKEAY